MESLKQKTVKGTLWMLFEKLSVHAVSFIVSMVLARLLTPADYGTVALTVIFFAVASTLVDSGFGIALIQKKDADDLDFNSVFYVNFVLSFIAYWALFFAAPWIADFYDEPELIMIVRVSAVCFLYNAINAIQGAWLAKKMLFHLSFRISLIICLCSGGLGIAFAYCGFGVWALVLASVITGIVGVIARWFIIGWRPKLMFSYGRLKPMFSIGWKMAASGLLESVFNNLDGLLIGKFYTKADLAYVNKGRALPAMAINSIEMTIGSVSMPALSQLQDDKVRLVAAMRRIIQCSTFLVFPLLVLIASCAKSELLLLYGEQWLPAVPYVVLCCFGYALTPFHTLNTRAFVVLGRTDIYLKLSIVKRALRFLTILLVFRFGVLTYMVIVAFVIGPISLFINTWPNKRLLDYSLAMQMRDILPALGACCAEAVVIFGAGWAFGLTRFSYASTGSNWSLLAVLALQASLGMASYFGLSFIMRTRAMGEYVRILSPILIRKMPRLERILVGRFSQC